MATFAHHARDGVMADEMDDEPDDDALLPSVVVRARMDLDVSRPHPEEGYAEYPWVGDVLVQWEERTPGGERVLRRTVVWTSAPRWDAPGYSSDEAEGLARRDAAARLAAALGQLCRDEELPPVVNGHHHPAGPRRPTRGS